VERSKLLREDPLVLGNFLLFLSKLDFANGELHGCLSQSNHWRGPYSSDPGWQGLLGQSQLCSLNSQLHKHSQDRYGQTLQITRHFFTCGQTIYKNRPTAGTELGREKS
jgi:hypothetical protein